MTYEKPLPNLDPDMEPFWEGLKRKEFLMFHCQQCGAWYWPPAYCRFHDNEPFMRGLKWEKTSGKGKVFAFNIHYRAFHAGFAKEIPYVYAMVKSDEGPIWGTNIVGCDPKEVHIGMPVEVVYEDTGTEWVLPKARPVVEPKRRRK